MTTGTDLLRGTDPTAAAASPDAPDAPAAGALLRAVLDALPLHVFWKGPDSRYLGCNATFAHDTGLAHPDEIIGRSDTDMFWGTQADRYQADDATVMQTGQPLPAYEEPWHQIGGAVRWVRTTKAPLLDTRGQTIGVLGVCEDVTRQRAADQRLRLTASLLERSREAVMVTAPDGTIIEVNEAFTRTTGYERVEAIGRNPRMLSSGQQGPEFYRTLWRTLNETGHWQGEIWNRKKSGDLYAELLTITAVHDEAGQLLHYLALFSDVTAAKAQQERLERVAHYDTLTGLPNRMLLTSRLVQAMAAARHRRQRIALVYIDLDDFGRINQIHGQSAGDGLLLRVAERLRICLGEGETLARVGGDEFVALLLGVDDESVLSDRLARLQSATRCGLESLGFEEQIAGSFGVTLYPQAEDLAAEQLLRQAEQAIYQAKVEGRQRIRYFDLAEESTLRRRHRMLTEVRTALAQDDLVLHYQPKVNMRTGALLGVEALLRWQHPERGLVPPGEFLPLVEDSLLAVDIGDWVLRTAMRQIVEWKAQGLRLQLSVNLSPIQLQQPDFIPYLRELLGEHPGVEPGDLELEIIESSAIGDIAAVSQLVLEAATLGIGFALDDFGTGYSSLTYLRRLPAGTLKIDRSFVLDMLHDLEDLSIIEGILGLARAFGRLTIAEGVETVAHGTALLALGCEAAQGYAIARPMPGTAIPAWARDWRPHPDWSSAAAA